MSDEREMAGRWLRDDRYLNIPITVSGAAQMLAEYAAWRDAQAWQPIESAPTHENPILLANAVEVAEGWCRECVDGSVSHFYADGDTFGGATHWREMPEPPK